MSKFPEKLRTKGKVEEDRYFARRDIELLKAMKKDRLARELSVLGSKKRENACEEVEEDFDKVSKRHRKQRRKLVKAYQKLLKRAKKIG